MKRITRDFITLFNRLWYRDFPLSENHKSTGSRAEWTTHIGICVRSCADLMGYFTHFEQGNRTDAIIKNNIGNDIAHIEWEWHQAFTEKVNEIQKLYISRNETEFSVFISYSRHDHHTKNMAAIKRQWRRSNKPLVVFLVTFDYSSKVRWFDKLETYHLQSGKITKVRTQPALPWNVIGSRWESNS